MRSKVIIVMPAYNASRTLEKTCEDIPKSFVDKIILVDDASEDDTVNIAKKLGLTVICHERNMGYGANQKTCYNAALKDGADIIIMIHPDYQYDSSLAPFFAELIERGVCDIVLGSRIRTRKECLDSGMPLYKYLSNRLLTLLENLVTGQNLAEWHTGYRAYSRKVLEDVPYQKNSNGFVFDSQFLIQAACLGFRLGDLPVPCRYMDEASSIHFRQSMIYGIGTIKVLFQFVLQKCHLMKFDIFESKNR